MAAGDAEPTPVDPAGIITRSVDEGSGFMPVQGPVVQTPAEPVAVVPRRQRPAAPFPWWPGAAAVAAALAVIVLDIVAVNLAGTGAYVPATILAWVAIAVSAIAVVVGALSIALDRGRRFGIAAVVVGVLANPFLLTRILEALHG